MRDSLLVPEHIEKRKSLSKPKSFIYVENHYDQSPEHDEMEKRRSFESDMKCVRQSCKAPHLIPPLKDAKMKNIDRSQRID